MVAVVALLEAVVAVQVAVVVGVAPAAPVHLPQVEALLQRAAANVSKLTPKYR